MFYTYKITNNITGEYYIGSHEWDDFLHGVAMKVPEQYQKYYTNPKYGVKEYRYGYTPLQNYLEENKDKILRDRAEGMSFRELGIKYEVSDSIITNCVNKWKNEHLL